MSHGERRAGEGDAHVRSAQVGQGVQRLIDRREHICDDTTSEFRSSSQRSQPALGGSKGVWLNGPSSNDCFAIPRLASRPAKLPYAPSVRRKGHPRQPDCRLGVAGRPGKSFDCARTWSVEVSAGRHVKHLALDGEQDLPSLLLAVKLCELLRRVVLEERALWSGRWHPVVRVVVGRGRESRGRREGCHSWEYQRVEEVERWEGEK